MERTEKREILQMHAKYSEAALVVMPIITPILEFCVKCQRNNGFKTDTLDFFQTWLFLFPFLMIKGMYYLYLKLTISDSKEK